MIKATSLIETVRPGKPNTCFFAPEGISTVARRDGVSPVYPVSGRQLFSAIIKTWSALERVETGTVSEAEMTASFVARTKLMRFKDDIDVEIIPLSDNRSSFIIYSRSRIGYSDMGANRKRVDQWLKVLSEHVKGT